MNRNGVYRQDAIRSGNPARAIEAAGPYLHGKLTQASSAFKYVGKTIRRNLGIDRILKQFSESAYSAIETIIDNSYAHEGAQRPSKLTGVLIGNAKRIEEHLQLSESLKSDSKTVYYTAKKPLDYAAEAIKDNSYVSAALRGLGYAGIKIANYARKKFDDWFYFYEALGQDGTTIHALKFRTMDKNTDAHLGERIIQNGIDRLGKINDEKYVIPKKERMRRCFIDEIPQLFYNVIYKKNMKLVGERPRSLLLWLKYINEGKTTLEEMLESLKEKPGLWGVHYRHPELDVEEGIRIWREFKKSRPGSADLNYFLNINYLIALKGVRSR